MTDDTTALRGLWENSYDADLLREMIGFAAERLTALEVGGLTDAGRGERSESRINQRNGYRERDWQTRAGTAELRIPRLRRGRNGMATGRASWPGLLPIWMGPAERRMTAALFCAAGPLPRGRDVPVTKHEQAARRPRAGHAG
jgi:hypothetical protein